MGPYDDNYNQIRNLKKRFNEYILSTK